MFPYRKHMWLHLHGKKEQKNRRAKARKNLGTKERKDKRNKERKNNNTVGLLVRSVGFDSGSQTTFQSRIRSKSLSKSVSGSENSQQGSAGSDPVTIWTRVSEQMLEQTGQSLCSQNLADGVVNPSLSLSLSPSSPQSFPHSIFLCLSPSPSFLYYLSIFLSLSISLPLIPALLPSSLGKKTKNLLMKSLIWISV